MLQKSVMPRTCNSEYRMDLWWFVQHMEFSSMLGSLCTEMHHPALKLKGETLRILCNCQEVTTQRPCLRNLIFIQKKLLILFCCRFILCRFCVAFFVHPLIMYFINQHVTIRQGFVSHDDFLSSNVPVCDIFLHLQVHYKCGWCSKVVGNHTCV